MSKSTSKSTPCPKCGSAAKGNFCGNCGAALGARHCTQCGGALPPGARFCTQCGATAGGAPRSAGGGGGGAGGSGGRASTGGDPHMGWWAAGGLLVVLILVVAWPILQPEAVAPVGVPAAGAAAGPAAIDLNSLTPRDAADRLFQRVMQAASAGDSAQAAQFLPMAIQAYDRARPLDLHGLFDLSTLQRTAGDFAGARATAEEGLAEDGDHLLLLYAAAQAAQEAGEVEVARGYYEHLMEVYDAEAASNNLDYQAHSTMLPTARTDAQAFLGGAD